VRARIGVAGALAALALTPLALAVNFGRAGHVAVGIQPTAIAVVDANDDGRFDLVTATASRSGVSLLRGRGDGTFLPRIDYPSVGAARSLAVADFNGDGWDDLATANVSGNSVSLLLGNGRTFVPGGRFPVGANPQAVAADDLDADGNIDLVTGNTGAQNPFVSVLFGSGDGMFAPPVGYETRTGSYSVAIVDLDGDSILDIASTDSAANTLSFLIGVGDGTFRQPALTSSPVGSRPRWVTVGPLGLYVASLGGPGGAGSGVYAVSLDTPATRFPVGPSPGWVTVDDLDSDGDGDIVATLPAANRVMVLSGTTLTAEGTGRSPSAAAVVDLNEDGVPDLAVANRGSNTVSVFLNDGQDLPPGAACVVPRVARKTLAAARSALLGARCTVGRVTRRHSRFRRGLVIAQRPRAGLQLPAGASVALVLSRGPRR
jgi:FG-GAP-like repeat/PASTA domain